jgi:signal transduction histidine kinase
MDHYVNRLEVVLVHWFFIAEGDMMRYLDAFPRFLLKLPCFIRLSAAILSVVFFLLLYMMVSPAARTPLMLAIPMALVAWMFRIRGVFICLASMVLVLWVYYSLRMNSLVLPSSMIISFVAATLALVVIGLLVSLLRDSLDVVDAAQLQSTRALEQQQQLNRAKDQFILHVNHELRTPLSAISGYLQLLVEYHQRFDLEERTKCLKQAMESCDDLQMMVGNVLDALHMDSGKEHLSLQACPVLQVVGEVLAESDPRWLHAHGVRLDVAEERVIVANEQYFRQILRNLLSNAFKYTPAGTEVLVSAHPYGTASQLSESPSQLCIQVKDAGPGIPPDELSNLFKQFARLKRDISGQVRGSGLGLYLSKQMVEAMGGQIWVESTGIPGQGSCFCLTLAAHNSQASINARLQEEIFH